MISRLLALMTMLVIASLAAVPSSVQTISNPVQLWQGYDPTAEPLEIEVVRRWDEDGCTFEKLRFTGETVNGVRTRVFAMQGAPVGKARLARCCAMGRWG